MFTVMQSGDIYAIKSTYDPALIALIKNVPGRIWVPDGKYWSIPVPHLGFFLKQIQGTPYEKSMQLFSEEKINQNATIDSTNNIPDIDISDMDQYVKEGFSLYPHQLDFLRYAKAHGTDGFILADDMGLGKTCEVINYALYQRKKFKYKHCLIIVCVNSAKYSWQDDIWKHTNGQEYGYILGSRKKRNGQIRLMNTGPDKVTDIVSGHMFGKESEPELPYFIITNIEAIGRTKLGKHFTLEESLIKMIEAGELPMIAIDECHKNMSPKSTQGKVILDMKKQTGNRVQWIPMTGTPVKNKPTDVFTPLKLVNGHAFKSFYKWCEQFCIMGGYDGHEIMAYKNIPLLKDMLQGHMIRRLKTEVLDLPPKIYFTEFVENTPKQQELYEQIEDEIYSRKEEILESMNPLTAMLRLRQVNGSPELIDSNIKVDDNYPKKNAKLTRLLELIDDIVERGEKVVVFSNWAAPLRTIYQFVSKRYKTCCYVGSMKEADREKHKRVFQNNPEYKVMLGTISAMGVSITLTAATNVIFYDDCWTPADKEQCEDRCNRIGSTASLNVYTLMSKYTVDERVYQILEDKRSISNFIVDGKLDLKKNPQLFDFLLGREKGALK